MRKTLSLKKRHAVLSGFGTAVLIMASSAVADSAEVRRINGGGFARTPEVAVHAVTWDAQRSSVTFVPEFFDGGGSGSTPETAVQAAIDDAKVTASVYGLYTCELVEEPAVFPRPPGSFRAFSAQVRMRCTP